MVTSPECGGLFLPLLQTIQDSSAPNSDRVDSYLTLTERLREEEDNFLTEVCQHIDSLAAVFKRDITSKQVELSQAALQTLGHCLYQEQISRTLTEKEAKEILSVLADVISKTSDKGVCTRALWCLAKQNLPASPFHDQLLKILTSIECALKKELQSPTVDNEALCVIERFLEQFPENIMRDVALHWCSIAFPLTVSAAGKVREHALSVISSNLDLIISAREEVVQWLLPALKTQLIIDLTKLCLEKKELFVLKVWECIVPVLGKSLHRSSMINDILKLVEQGFKNSSVAVQVESYNAWQVLIDNFALSQDVLSSQKRVNLIMMPLLNSAVKERNEKVESARLAAWWHFVCSFEHSKLLELFDKVCIPLLQFIFGTGIDHVSLLKSKEGFGDLKCPPTPNTGKSISTFQTPKATARRSLRDVGTPKTPTVINASFAQATKDKLFRQGCEILVNMLSQDCVSSSMKFTIDQTIKETLFQSPSDFEKHAKVLINAVREAIKACGKEIPDELASCLWSNLVDQVERLVITDRSNMFDPYFLSLVAVAEEIIEGAYVSPTTCMKFLERLSKTSPDLLNHHNASLHSKDNPQGSTAVLMLQHLLSPQLLQSGKNNLERLHTGFQNFFTSGIIAPSGHLFHVQAVLHIMEKSASFINDKSCLWRLWSHVVSSLNEYIIKSNEVNQGNALEHDFTAVYLAFMLPVKELLNHSLDQEHIRLINKDLENLYRSFSRAAGLVSSLETNLYAEELCCKFLVYWDDSKAKDVYYLSGLGNLVSVILECMDYTANTPFISKSPIKSPSKWTKKIQQPLGNFKSVLHLTSKVLLACHDVIKTKKTDDCSGIFAVVLTNIVDNLSLFYQHLNGPSVIASATDALAQSLVPIFQLSHQSTKEVKSNIEKAVFTKKFIQKVEKLWLDILTSVQSRHGEPYSSELLSTLSPLLEVTLNHHRRQLKNQSIQFWNSTFATASTLTYPDSLKPVLKSVKDKACLILPGWNEDNSKQTSSAEIEEPSQMSQVTQGSPVRIKPIMFFGGSPKIKGSFLHKAAEAEKAVEKNSPKKPWTEPRLPSKGKSSNRNTHARRKLPLSVFDDDSQDYVTIAPSPTKKRLLTEHQKEVMREKSVVPALYNFLDQSQDATFMTQETLCTPSPVEDLPEPLVGKDSKSNQTNKNNASINEKEKSSDTKKQTDPKANPERVQEIPEVMEIFVAETQHTETENQISLQETPTKDQPMTSSDQEEMTSPDVIPSSQLSSESASPSFKSLRRSTNAPGDSMVVLLKDVTTEKEKSYQSVTQYFSPIKKGNEYIEEKVVEGKTDSEAQDDFDIVLTDLQSKSVKSSGKKKKVSVKKENASPISGRTRRGRQLKLTTPKKQPNENPSLETEIVEQIPETENFSDTQTKNSPEKISHEDNQLQTVQDTKEQTEMDVESINMEVKAKPSVHGGLSLNNDGASSPVSCAKIRFMKPNTQSPTQTSLRVFHSPVASPTASILKRSTGRYDSPSPPNKVRRVSFAQPLAQEAEDDRCKEAALPDNPSSTCQPHEASAQSATLTTTPSKGSDSTSFTLIKRRRKTPTKADEHSGPCIYPDLVDCSLPVEQILPSLTSITWSRGLGHVVYAQNIRTIGNLSALKEHQIRNLPIKSPKVETLRTALQIFHQKSSKGVKAKTTLLMGQEKKSLLSDSIPTIPECNEPTVNHRNDAETLKEPLTSKEQEGEETKECDLKGEITNDEKHAEQTSGVAETRKDEDTSTANSDGSFTPPLPKPTLDSRRESATGKGNVTPSRSSLTEPIVLFSQEESQETEDNFYDEVMSKLDGQQEDNVDVDAVASAEITDEKQSKDTKIVEIPSLHDNKEQNETNVANNAETLPSSACEEESQEKKFSESLKSIVEIATPEVLARLSSEDIFDAHKNLTDLMARVGTALQSKMAASL